MKRFLCVALLMGLTTALHAVTYTWDSTSNTFTDRDGNTLGKYKDITNLVISVTCTRSSDEIVMNFFSLVQKDAENSTTNLFTFGVTGNNPYRANITIGENTLSAGGGHWSWQRAGADKTFTTVFNFSNPNSSGALQTLNANYTFTTNSDSESDTWASGVNANFNGLSLDGLTAYDKTTLVSATIEIEGTSVPEPGLLALLALGGAGLVLRRRKVRA